MFDKRLFTRVPSSLEVDLELENGRIAGGRITDLSIRGLYLRTSDTPPIGAPCKVVLFPATHDHADLTIEVVGVVARHAEGGVGVKFLEFTYEAFEQLRELVLFGADEPGEVNAEIEKHFGPTRETA